MTWVRTVWYFNCAAWALTKSGRQNYSLQWFPGDYHPEKLHLLPAVIDESSLIVLRRMLGLLGWTTVREQLCRAIGLGLEV